MNLHAIDADVDPAAFFGLAGDDAVGGADVAAAVELMPVRRRKNRHVDVGAGLDVLQNRPIRDHARRNRLDAFEQLFPVGDEFDRSGIGGHADGQARARRCVDQIRRDAKVGRMTGHLIEEHQRRRFFESEQLGQRADLQFPMGAVDLFDLAELARGIDEFA